MTDERAEAFGKQVFYDGKHFADAATPEAAEVIALCIAFVRELIVEGSTGGFPNGGERTLERFFS